MPRRILAISAILAFACGCQSGQRVEIRTHTIAPWQVSQMPAWEETIEMTVAPEKWNEEGSLHRISATGNQLTIRTTKSNQDAILKYLATVVTAD